MENTLFISIADFGAVNDGKTLCTQAFADAIEACAQNGGGTVLVPAGKYLTGPVFFKSHITLQIEAGARILFVQDKEQYPLVMTRWEGAEHEAYAPLFYGRDLENVAITGRGIVDGQGEYWWEQHRSNTLTYPRPRFISFENCTNVLIEGIQIVDSPCWTINPICCNNVTVNKITICNPANSPNTDGINPDSCKNVHISNCHVDVGDDCITIKSGTEDCQVRIPCENITITNCTMVHGHGAVVIGSEMSGGVRNVTISNCVFEGTDRGIRIKSRRRRGGAVEDIRVSNIVMKEVICPFVLNLYYYCGEGGKDKIVWDKSPYPINEGTPAFRRIHFHNITAREVQAAAGFIYGLAEQYIEDVTFNNISIHMAEDAKPDYPAMMSNLEPMKQKGFFCSNARDIIFDRVSIQGQEGPAFTLDQGEHIEFANCYDYNKGSEYPFIKAGGVEQLITVNCKKKDGTDAVIAE